MNMTIGAITTNRTDLSAIRQREALREQGLANPTDAIKQQLGADEFERVKTSHAQFVAARDLQKPEAQVVGLWAEHNKGGVPRFRWHGPGDTETFYMSVRVKNGDPRAVVPQLWTNINHGLKPEDFEGIPMQFAKREGDVVTFKATLPIDKIGNFRVTGRISTSGDAADPRWAWAANSGVGDIRFRPRAVENESISEQVVHIGLANADPSGSDTSTLRDLIDPTPGKYNLWAIKAAGKNAIRLQPPFRAERWDRAHPYDTLGSPYAATDFLSIDPRYSRDVQQAGIPASDVDKQRQVANAEFWRVVDKAHELGMKVILDVALNHSGHNLTFRDLFDDPVAGEKVMRNNFDQLVVNADQKKAVAERLAKNPNGSGEELFPEMFAASNWDAQGAHTVDETVAGGNGQWGDTKQLNHGGFNWGGIEKNATINQNVTDWYTRILKYWVDPPDSESGAPTGAQHGVDGFRFDHSSNLPTRFWERSLTQLQALVDKPIAVIAEDFNQGEKLRVYADAMESGWYKDIIARFQASDINGIHGIIDNDYFFETLRGGNHDEERIVAQFGGDMMAAGRYLCMIDLLGGISTTVMGDEFGEQKKVEFKHKGGVPPVLVHARYNQLSQANVELELAMSRAGRARSDDPSLRTVLRERLYADGPEHNILAVARHADDRALPGTLVFANLANADVMQNKFWLDGETRARIDPDGTYQARDLMSKTPDANLWSRPIKGSELLANGLFVKLNPYQIQALKLDRVA